MTARGIGIFTIEFPDPTKIDYVNNQFNTLNETISFQYRGLTNLRTLSTKGVDANSDPYGILFVPDLFTEACRRNESDHVPANATRIANLPADRNYALIAFAPWFSPQCMVEYFTAARQQATTKGFLTYLPGTDNAQPPVLNSPAWDLQDGGMWQSDNFFPTYALSSTSGSTVIDQLNLYSGNLSTVPNGDDLARIFDSTSYVRLWATVSTEAGGTLPSLWVFLVIVLAILIAAIGTTSLCMHLIQRRRRNALRQRVLNGEVDLEALGVKRLTVSQQALDKMPIVTYTVGPTDAEKPDLNTASHPHAPPTASTTAPTTASFSQPTCPICIDDFEPNETQVRELPCRHIFHPDCIDTFLLRSSSLCPMCKQSVLPAGACPVKITNMMVRRERHIARMRFRSDWSAAHGGMAPPVSVTVSDQARGAFGSLGRRFFSRSERRGADIELGSTAPTIAAQGNPNPTQTQMQMQTQTQTQQTSLPATHTAPPTLPPDLPAQPDPPASRDCNPRPSAPLPATPATPLNRREWARQRALALLGPRAAPPETEVEVDGEGSAQQTPRPKWKRVLRGVFPGFG